MSILLCPQCRLPAHPYDYEPRCICGPGPATNEIIIRLDEGKSGYIRELELALRNRQEHSAVLADGIRRALRVFDADHQLDATHVLFGGTRMCVCGRAAPCSRRKVIDDLEALL